jgi:hypothetical protein
VRGKGIPAPPERFGILQNAAGVLLKEGSRTLGAFVGFLVGLWAGATLGTAILIGVGIYEVATDSDVLPGTGSRWEFLFLVPGFLILVGAAVAVSFAPRIDELYASSQWNYWLGVAVGFSFVAITFVAIIVKHRARAFAKRKQNGGELNGNEA